MTHKNYVKFKTQYPQISCIGIWSHSFGYFFIGYFLTLLADLRSWGSDLMASRVRIYHLPFRGKVCKVQIQNKSIFMHIIITITLLELEISCEKNIMYLFFVQIIFLVESIRNRLQVIRHFLKLSHKLTEHLRTTGVRLWEEVWSTEREESGFGGQLTALTSLVCDVEYCILLLCATVFISVKWGLDLRGSPSVKTPRCFQCKEWGIDSWLGN